MPARSTRCERGGFEGPDLSIWAVFSQNLKRQKAMEVRQKILDTAPLEIHGTKP